MRDDQFVLLYVIWRQPSEAMGGVGIYVQAIRVEASSAIARN